MKMSLCDDMEELKSMLKDYESKEEYERCAILNDKIKELGEI